MSASVAYRRLSYLGMSVLLRHSWPHGEKDRVRDLIFVTATCVYSDGFMGPGRAKEFSEWCSSLMHFDPTSRS